MRLLVPLSVSSIPLAYLFLDGFLSFLIVFLNSIYQIIKPDIKAEKSGTFSGTGISKTIKYIQIFKYSFLKF
ncbi:hypothetical protein DLM77_08205 [Leptospira yasudae]|uniref:Uncharacterized protein n=1 Tax=Leptospira yasudae TaxID=2202201 RepID=A0ABX9M5B1_9LEPT|nr:hypothetical protein DLM77_08205 [Leptospira yasudae]